MVRFWTMTALAGALVACDAPAETPSATVDDVAAAAPTVSPAAPDTPAPQPEPFEEPNDPGITAAEFAALKTGMTPKQVEKIVGSLGQIISENEIAGIRTVMVQWPGERGVGANANAMFQNGKLIQKAQFGLQ